MMCDSAGENWWELIPYLPLPGPTPNYETVEAVWKLMNLAKGLVLMLYHVFVFTAWWLVPQRPSNMLAYLNDGSTQTTLRAEIEV